MWNALFINAIGSIIIIMLCQYLWDYLKTQYTVRKTIRLDVQNSKYKSMLEDLAAASPPDTNIVVPATKDALPPPPNAMHITKEDSEWLTKELNGFLMEISK